MWILFIFFFAPLPVTLGLVVWSAKRTKGKKYKGGKPADLGVTGGFGAGGGPFF